MFLLAKYGVQTSIQFPMVQRGLVDLASGDDWTPATADTRITKDGAASAQSTNLPACSAAPEVSWSLTLTAAELTGKAIAVQIIDAATKAVEDQYLIIYTYGHPNAKIPMDLDTGLNTTMVETYAGVGSAPTFEQAIMAIHQMLMDTVTASTVMTVKRLDGTSTAFTLSINAAFPVGLPTSIARAT